MTYNIVVYTTLISLVVNTVILYLMIKKTKKDIDVLFKNVRDLNFHTGNLSSYVSHFVKNGSKSKEDK